MPNCSFCGSKEDKQTPLCQSCGALRYPVATNNSSATVSRQDKLKLTAAVAVAAITPGSFILLALVGASRLSLKPKNKKYR
ncbi:MAG: hypothetical protein L3J75_07005 [Methylococcaceae bacterium]|nr:hypothetical protein [Methylococcaceae bacterium]